MTRWITAVLAFAFMFAAGFFLGGWFLMPYLPPYPTSRVSVWEAEYWTTNWAGAVLGLLLGLLSARSSLRRR